MNHSALIDQLGGVSAVARMTGVSAPTAHAYRQRGIPAERCPAIERATAGRWTVDTLCPSARWSRIPDPAWPHPAGRPVIDVARPVAAVKEAA
jgi:DNA-binding transcriptional regulator YdaS (Cro superfamily)